MNSILFIITLKQKDGQYDQDSSYLQIHVAYYRYPRLKQDLKLTPVRPVVNPSASILDESRFINNPAYEQTTQTKSGPGLGRKTHGNGIMDGSQWTRNDR